jgi:hypothetical protein
MTITKKPRPDSSAAPSGAKTSPRASAKASELRLLAAEAGTYAFYRWQNVAINIWTSQPTAPAVQVLTELTELSLSECPGGLASIHWLDQGVSLPTSEARVGLGELAKQYERHLICVAVLLSGSGFWASATRSALTGIMLLAPRSFSLRFFGDAFELCTFIARELARRGPSPVELERLLAVVEEALAARGLAQGRP